MDVRDQRPTAPRDVKAIARMRRAGRVAALVAGLVGGSALAGWAIGNAWLRSAGRQIEMQPNAAAAVVLAAAAVVFALGPGRGARFAARALAAIVTALAAVTLVEHATGVDLLVDRVLYPAGHAPSPWTKSAGRMGLPAALALLVSAGAITLLSTGGRRAATLAQTVALAAAPLPLLALVGYAYDVPFLYAASLHSTVALPTALALLLIDAAVILARPDEGFVANLASSGTGSGIARRMLLYAVVLPIAIGWLALSGARPDAQGALAVSVAAVALTLTLVLLVLREALVLERMEAAREHAQAEREASRHELARALRREQDARAQAEAASRAKDEFLNTLSHELRSPLNAIVGWTKLLRDGAADPERLGRGLAVVDRNARTLAQVVSDLLDMSRIARGVMQLDRSEVDVGAAVGAAVEAVRPAAEAKGVALARRIPPVPPVLGDAARVRQVAWNLLSNAVKFTPTGGRIDVAVAAEGPDVVLSVEDTGAGISSEFLPHVFERFRQADGSDTRRHGGLGLGLALTRELVVLHGGSIEVASAGQGRGATFRVTFPQAPQEAPVLPAVTRERPHLGAARILVVDDEADSRELLLQLLQAWGARPEGAASVRDALAAAARARPDLLVSDIAMPGEDGCALVMELRKLERALGQAPVPALALTAFGRPEDRRRVLAAGFDAHVSKPIEPDELRVIIAGLLRREPRPAVAARVDGVPAPAPAPPVGAPRPAPGGAFVAG
jgi:signal transduction histidine kinase/ActR/RegA family two-component response regulator